MLFDGLEEVRSMLAQAGLTAEGTGETPPLNPWKPHFPTSLAPWPVLRLAAALPTPSRKVHSKGKASTIIKEAEQKGENIKEKKILQAKESSSSSKKNTARRSRPATPRSRASRRRLKNTERNLKRDNQQLSRSEKRLQRDEDTLKSRMASTENKQKELDKSQAQAAKLLGGGGQHVGGRRQRGTQVPNPDDARAMAAREVQDILDEARGKANQDAKKIVIQTIQRVATEHAVENSVSVFNIGSDDIKGRIIGREGRKHPRSRPQRASNSSWTTRRKPSS